MKKRIVIITTIILATIVGWSYKSSIDTVLGAPVSTIMRNILPETDNTYDLGSTSPNRRWKNIWSVTGTFTDVTVSGTCTGCGSATLSGGSANTLTYWTSGTAVSATSSPTVGYIAATTTATSTFRGPLQTWDLLSASAINATSTINTTSTATSTWSGGHALTSASLSQGLTITGGSLLNTSTATSTFSNGIDITAGCYRKNGACLTEISSTLTGILEEVGGVVGVVTIGSSLDYTGTTLSVGTVSIGDGGTGLTTIGASSTVATSDGTNFKWYNDLSLNGLTLTGSATSSFTGGHSALGLSSSGGLTITAGSILNTSTATSTFSGGLRFPNMNCSAHTNGGVLTVDASGNVICSDDDGGGSGSGTVNSGVENYFAYYPSTDTTVDDQTILNIVSSKIGIGTTTPGKLLSVNNDTVISGNLDVAGIFATSTINTSGTATSTFAGGLSLTNLKSSTGIEISGGTLLNTSSATSSFTGALSTTNLRSSLGLSVTGGIIESSGNIKVTSSATSTFSGGVNISTTGGLASASGLTITGGAIKLGTDTITDFTGTGLQLSGTSLTLNATGDWTGTLDSIEGASFLRSDASDNYTSGTLTLDSGTVLTGASGSTVNINGAFEAGGATGFEIMNGSAPTVDAVGETALDTTSNMLLVATSTNATYPGTILTTHYPLYTFTIATTSAQYKSGTQDLPIKGYGIDVYGIICHVTGGTGAGDVTINLTDGTNDTNTAKCTRSLPTVATTTSSNDTWTAFERRAVEYASAAGTFGEVQITVLGEYIRD